MMIIWNHQAVAQPKLAACKLAAKFTGFACVIQLSFNIYSSIIDHRSSFLLP